MKNLSEQIKNRRVSLGWSQKRLSEETGISQPQLSKFEKKLPPFRMSTLERIAAAMGCDIQITLTPQEEEDGSTGRTFAVAEGSQGSR